MTSTPLPTLEEIQTIYREGEEATVALIERLVARIRALEDQLAKDSHNSSKPPSSDGLKRRAKRGEVGTSGKKSGGQEGHAGCHLESVVDPKYVKVHPVSQCSHCQASLEGVEVDGYEKRQVFDLPVVELEAIPVNEILAKEKTEVS
jgi:transposase